MGGSVTALEVGSSGHRLVPRALLPLNGLGDQAVGSKMLPGNKEDTWQTPSGLHGGLKRQLGERHRKDQFRDIMED